MSVSRRIFITSALAGAAAVCQHAARAAFPERPLRLIVPFPAGGAVDVVGRLLGNALSSAIGQPVVIDNRGGAGGIIGMEASARAAPDGYTVMVSHSGFAAMPGLYRKLPFDPAKDFDGVVTAVSGSYVLAVHPSVPFRSVAELIAFAKANPGKLTYASAGVGSTVHLGFEFFKRVVGVDILHVPYRGAAPAITDLVGGQVHMLLGSTALIDPFAKSGNVRALAVTSAKRSALMPGLPTIAETLPGFDVVGWYGLVVPAGTPRDVTARLNAKTLRVLKSADLLEQFRQQGYEPVGNTPAEASAYIRSEVARWSQVIRDAGIEPQ